MRVTTGVSTPKRSCTTPPTAAPTFAAERIGESRTMLPLCTYVRTFVKPASVSASRRTGIDTLLTRPRLTARSNATQVGTP